MPTRPASHYERSIVQRQPAMAKAADRGRPSAARRGYGSTWQRLRTLALHRDPICQDESDCTQPSTDVDHIVSLARGGTNELTNLQGLCHSHHSQKTNREDGGGWAGQHRAAPGGRGQGVGG